MRTAIHFLAQLRSLVTGGVPTGLLAEIDKYLAEHRADTFEVLQNTCEDLRVHVAHLGVTNEELSDAIDTILDACNVWWQHDPSVCTPTCDAPLEKKLDYIVSTIRSRDPHETDVPLITALKATNAELQKDIQHHKDVYAALQRKYVEANDSATSARNTIAVVDQLLINAAQQAGLRGIRSPIGFQEAVLDALVQKANKPVQCCPVSVPATEIGIALDNAASARGLERDRSVSIEEQVRVVLNQLNKHITNLAFDLKGTQQRAQQHWDELQKCEGIIANIRRQLT